MMAHLQGAFHVIPQGSPNRANPDSGRAGRVLVTLTRREDG